MPWDDARELDPVSLKGLAHPLRIRILTILDREGAGTATGLAGRVGESTGSTSYHLRQLAKHGFVEEVPDRGRGRERWWQPTPGGFIIKGSEMMRQPATRRAARIVVREINRARAERLDEWLTKVPTAAKPWRGAAVDMSYDIRFTPAQLRALVTELDSVIEAHRALAADNPTADTERVEIQLNAFPLLP